MEGTQTLQVGDRIPALALTRSDGAKVDLNQYGGNRSLMVYFINSFY